MSRPREARSVAIRICRRDVAKRCSVRRVAVFAEDLVRAAIREARWGERSVRR